MKRLHLSIFALFGWFFLFYNVERIYEPVNLASFVYLLAPALGLLMLSVPRLHRISPYLYIPLSLVMIIALRQLLGYRIDGSAFSLTVTESLATCVTIWLSSQLSHGIAEYHNAAATAIFSHVTDRCRPFEEAQGDVVREVRRARHFNRPIAVMALSAKPQDEHQALDRFTDEFKSLLLRQFVSAQAADCLGKLLKRHDILTQTKDQFLALLPEMDREDAECLAAEMRQELDEKLGLDLEVGISMFPEDEITAIGLIDRAEQEVNSAQWAASNAFEDLHRQSNIRPNSNQMRDDNEVESLAP